LEQALIAGDLVVAELPGAWNEKYRAYLGIEPPNNADGVMQDVHWAAGLVGYFPTYSLGNLYASQLFAQAGRDLGDLAGMFRRGEFLPLRDWPRKHVHEQARRYSPAELIEHITGEPLSHTALIQHLRDKYVPLYARG